MHRFKTGLSDSVINITTRYSADLIEQEVSNGREVIARNVCQLQDEGARKALSKLGYLSPEEAKGCVPLESYKLIVDVYVEVAKERNQLLLKLKSLKEEWEKRDYHEVSIEEKLETLINILYSDR